MLSRHHLSHLHSSPIHWQTDRHWTFYNKRHNEPIGIQPITMHYNYRAPRGKTIDINQSRGFGSLSSIVVHYSLMESIELSASSSYCPAIPPPGYNIYPLLPENTGLNDLLLNANYESVSSQWLTHRA